jgi:mRNA interferase MazF
MPKRGECYWLDLGEPRGSVQAGRRPVCVIQNDLGNRYSTTTIVAVLTTRTRPAPFHVQIKAQESGLPRDSEMRCEKLLTVNQADLGEQCGVLPDTLIPELDRALRASLGIVH